MDRLSFVQTGKTQMVVWSVDSDVLGLVFIKGGHKSFEIRLSASLAEVLGGEVSVHAGTVPVGLAQRLAMEVDVHAVFFAETAEEVAGHPHFIGSAFGPFTEDLEFPLAFGHFGIDPLMVDAGIKTKVKMLFNNLTGNISHVAIADAAVVSTLTFFRKSFRGEAERLAVFVQEILLLETEPRVGIIENRGTGVGWMWCEIRKKYLAENNHAVDTGGIMELGNRFEHAVRRMPLGLLR